MAVARKATPAAESAGAPAEAPDFEVVGDTLVCHSLGLRLPLVVSMSAVERWMEINASAQSWQEQVAAWQSEIMPLDVLAAIREAAAGDGIREVELSRRWSWGLDERLGKALS